MNIEKQTNVTYSIPSPVVDCAYAEAGNEFPTFCICFLGHWVSFLQMTSWSCRMEHFGREKVRLIQGQRDETLVMENDGRVCKCFGTDSKKREKGRNKAVLFSNWVILESFSVKIGWHSTTRKKEDAGRVGRKMRSKNMGSRLEDVQRWRAGLCPCGLGVKSTDLNIPDLNPAVDLCASRLCFPVTERKKAQREGMRKKRSALREEWLKQEVESKYRHSKTPKVSKQSSN